MKLWKRLISIAVAVMMVFAVMSPAYAASSVKLNKSKAEIYVGESVQLKISGTKKKVVWSSSKNSVAKVSSNGKVTGVKAGAASVKAKVGGKTYTCKVTVKNPYLNKTSITLAVSESATLKLNGGKIKSVKSSDTKVVTAAKSGKLTAKKTGKATITVTSTKGKKYTCKVTVKKPYLDKTSITLIEGKSATLKLNGGKIKSAKSSDTKVVTVTNDGKLTAKKAGKATITVTSTKDKKYTCKVTVEKEKVYTVKFDSNGGSPVASVSVTNGKKVAEPETPTREGYEFTGWYINQDCTTRFDFSKTAITKDVTLYAGWTKVEAETPVTDLSYEGYTMKWSDEFDGNELNRDDWNVELHEPGWVNAELQEYVDSEENIRVEDGKLILKAHKDADGSITSGRVNTQNKHDYKYGLMEAKVKVPAGKGYLPAFWMMPTDENLYGQWPRCGEIDIMEVMGQETTKSYGTIHFGNPHSEKQGTKVLETGDFSEEYHTFAVEWEPGSIKWYVDGELIHEANDWYSTTVNQGTITYPAPFDQDFYVILNLAVGGSWVGYPDDNAEVEGEFCVDYVRVYQKASYDENVTAPEKEQATMRDADESGNYVINGDFAQSDALDGSQAWEFMTQQNGDASAEIADGMMKITTRVAGDVDYAIQLVQAGVPAEKGATYRLTFDAKCDGENRTGIVNVDAVDRGWSRYLADSTFNVTNEWQTFTYEYSMTDDNDPNARLEFNLGNTSPISTLYLDNVRIEKIDQKELTNDKVVLANGNYVYNGRFQEGTGRLAYWDIDNQAGASVSVTNEKAHDRRLKIVAPEGTSEETPIIISQDKLAVTANSDYALSFDADGDAGNTIHASMAGVDMSVTLTGESQTVKKSASTGETVDRSVVFTITEAGTYYIDNVSIVEDSLIKNGSFNAGLSGYEAYVYSNDLATYVVDSLKEDNAFSTTINNSGTEDWHIQLKQSSVKLEEGQWYRLTLKMKSTLDREVVVAIQRDGNAHNNDWTPYVQKTVPLGAEYETYTLEFQMNPATAPKTDTNAIFNVAMGKVNGNQITTQHTICIDNINLEKIDAPEQEEGEEEQPAGHLLLNADFSEGMANWSETIANWDSSVHADASSTIVNGVITYAIKDAGEQDWHVQLKQSGITLEEGKTYTATFKATATADRSIMAGLQNADDYTYYAGTTAELKAGEEQAVTVTVTMNKRDSNVAFYVSMGSPMNDTVQAPCDIILSEMSLVENN